MLIYSITTAFGQSFIQVFSTRRIRAFAVLFSQHTTDFVPHHHCPSISVYNPQSVPLQLNSSQTKPSQHPLQPLNSPLLTLNQRRNNSALFTDTIDELSLAWIADICCTGNAELSGLDLERCLKPRVAY